MRLICLYSAVAVLVTGAACGKNQTVTAPTPAPTAATIGLSGNLAFGSVAVGTTATAELTISNSGGAELTVTGISYPAGLSGSWASGSIAAAASQVVTVTFAPTAPTLYTGAIAVSGNQASGTSSIAVSGTGTVEPTFTLSGQVTESAPTTSTSLAGVYVVVVDGANQGKSATTGADGRYEITGVSNGGYTVGATLAGYVASALPIGIDGNTTLNFRLDPIAARTRFGPGQYRVNTDIPPGRYYSDPGHGCHFKRQRGFGGTSSDVISETQVNFDAGQWIVELLATDAGFETDSSCGAWFTTPRGGPQGSISPGSWAVGLQITPGTYRAENSVMGCDWQRLSGFTGAADAVISAGFAGGPGPQIVTIASTDAGFSTHAECGIWTRTNTTAASR